MRHSPVDLGLGGGRAHGRIGFHAEIDRPGAGRWVRRALAVVISLGALVGAIRLVLPAAGGVAESRAKAGRRRVRLAW
jgi:hypothetical protein